MSFYQITLYDKENKETHSMTFESDHLPSHDEIMYQLDCTFPHREGGGHYLMETISEEAYRGIVE
jgi:hypothetical protein